MKNITTAELAEHPYNADPFKMYGIEPNDFKNKSVLVVHDLQAAIVMSGFNKVVYVTADEDSYDWFKRNIVNNPAFGKDDAAYLIQQNWASELKDIFDELVKDMKKKFDCCIMNPPWGRLGWQIAYEAWKRTDSKVVCLNSSNILHTLSRFEEKSYFQKYKEMFGCLKSEKVIPRETIMKMFKSSTRGVQSSAQASLTVFGKTYTEPEMTKFEKIITNHIKENPANYQTNILSKYAVYIPYDNCDARECQQLRAHMIVCENKNNEMICCYDRYLVKGKRETNVFGKIWWDCYNKSGGTKRQPALTAGIPFKTFEEAKNFVDSQDTKFMRFVNSKLLTDRSVSQKNIFFMNDYTKPWTDERFKKHFKLTDEEWNAIAMQ